VVIGLKHPYLNTGQTLTANLSIPLNLATPYRASGLVVRPRGCRINTVQVRVGECHSSVAEGNCVVVRRGEKQLEANYRSAGDELDSAVCDGEPSTKWRSLKRTGHAVVVVKAMVGCMLWLEVER